MAVLLASLAGGPTQTVTSGPFLVAAVLAVAAGAVSFASPCVIPLVPGYLSYLVGLVGSETVVLVPAGSVGSGSAALPARSGVRRKAVIGAGLFVAGFTVVFLAETLAALGVAHTLLANTGVLTRVGGVVTIVMGVVMLGFIRPLQAERRIHRRPTGRVFGAVLLGAFFALGWTACLGPTLTGVVSLAAATDWNGSAWRGLFLVVFYCAGLGIPFLLLAFGFGWATTAMGFLRRHTRTIQIVGAVMLIVVGLVMVTGLWSQFVAWLQVHSASFGSPL